MSQEEFQLLLTLGNEKDLKQAVFRTNQAQAIELFFYILNNYPLNESTDWKMYNLLLSLLENRSKAFKEEHYVKLFTKVFNYYKDNKTNEKAKFFLIKIKALAFSSNTIDRILENYANKQASLISQTNFSEVLGFYTSFNIPFYEKTFKHVLKIFKTELNNYSENNKFKIITSYYESLYSLLMKSHDENYFGLLEKEFLSSLNKFETKFLLGIYKTYQDLDRKSGYYDEKDNYHMCKLLKQVLDSREHILKNKDKKLISLMSKHAGKKLSFKEAQRLHNVLKRKS